MPPRNRQPKHIAEPGSAPVDTVHDEDAALAAGQAGGTHEVRKHADPETLPPSPVQGDPLRKKTAPVNAKQDMTYAQAMKKHEAAVELRDLRDIQAPSAEQRRRIAELAPIAQKKAILTELGWLAPPNARTKG